jgi:Protein of unknown function (DUF3179)
MIAKVRLLLLPVLAALVACAPSTTAPSGRPSVPSTNGARTSAPSLAGPALQPSGPSAQPQLLPEERVPFSTTDWETNFKKHTIPFGEILSGGPPKGGIGVDEGIPALVNPKFISPAEATRWLRDNEPVIFLSLNGENRAYPIQILIWHEIVNDEIGGTPIVVTFCPLCNSAIVFLRTVAGEATTFGTTGKLHYSDLVMYDSTTESWWQQLTGEAIVGDRVGTKLTALPSQVVSFVDFKTRFADGKVLSRDTGMSRRYGSNPYLGYDSNNSPFLYSGPDTPAALKPIERVVIVQQDQNATVYAYSLLAKQHVVNDEVGNQPVVVFWKAGTNSALDSPAVSAGRDIGSTGVFDPRVDGRWLTFEARADNFIDRETGSTWNILGLAMEGALKGKQLTPIVHGDFFWFAWAAFRPDSKIYTGSQ